MAWPSLQRAKGCAVAGLCIRYMRLCPDAAAIHSYQHASSEACVCCYCDEGHGTDTGNSTDVDHCANLQSIRIEGLLLLRCQCQSPTFKAYTRPLPR